MCFVWERIRMHYKQLFKRYFFNNIIWVSCLIMYFNMYLWDFILSWHCLYQVTTPYRLYFSFPIIVAIRFDSFPSEKTYSQIKTRLSVLTIFWCYVLYYLPILLMGICTNKTTPCSTYIDTGVTFVLYIILLYITSIQRQTPTTV